MPVERVNNFRVTAVLLCNSIKISSIKRNIEGAIESNGLPVLDYNTGVKVQIQLGQKSCLTINFNLNLI